MALGSEPGRILRSVVGEGLGLAAAGLTVGVVAAVGLARFVEDILFGVRPIDLPTFGLTAALLLGVAAAASWLPARRATQVHPSVALRAD
jgi:ABC-type lipoprotein release transport system permease subunit